MAKAKNINIYKLFSKTYNERPMYSFVGFGELALMPKVKKPIRQVSSLYQFPILSTYNQKHDGDQRCDGSKWLDGEVSPVAMLPRNITSPMVSPSRGTSRMVAGSSTVTSSCSG